MTLLSKSPETLAGVVLGGLSVTVLPVTEDMAYSVEELAWLRQLDDDAREQFVDVAETMLVGLRDWAQELLDAIHEAAAE